MNYTLLGNFQNEAPRDFYPEVYACAFSHTTSVRQHTQLILFRSDKADNWNLTQALTVTPMYSHPGGVKGDQGWLPSLLSQHTPNLSLSKSNNCPWMNKWLVLCFLWWVLEPLMYCERIASSHFLKMRSCLHYETDAITKIACISFFG